MKVVAGIKRVFWCNSRWGRERIGKIVVQEEKLEAGFEMLWSECLSFVCHSNEKLLSQKRIPVDKHHMSAI